MSLRFFLRASATLLLALAAALLCVWLRTPLPWMIGPLLATSVVRCWAGPRAAGRRCATAQWMIGTALGLYFTPQVTAPVASLWWAILLAIAWRWALGWGFGRWLHARHAQRMGGSERAQWATTYFAGAIGGASEMTCWPSASGGRTDLVAAAHSVRPVIVTLAVPFAFQTGLQAWTPPARPRR